MKYAINRKNLGMILLGGIATLMTVVQPVAAQEDEIKFNLHPSPAVVNCISKSGWDSPSATVTVHRGKLNDTLTITGKNIKPGLAFDMFTVQRSNLLADGTVDPNFTNFGLAWYQSDLQADSEGKFSTTIKTILLDQIFGFDPDAGLAPLNTFHVGFWFNNPKAAKACGFDPTHPTPFNGEHKAGPVAMISVPDANTNLGPLCTNPTSNGACNP
jgi:hypothetical protein